MFVDFVTVQQVSRKKIPFGIAQIGRSFRNEITPGNFIYRLREFEQMEMEFFVEPGTDEDWHEYWIGERMRWWTDLGLDEDTSGPRARRRRAVALLEAHRRHRVPLPVHGLGRARGDREPDGLRPEGARGGLRRGPHVLRPGEGARATTPT